MSDVPSDSHSSTASTRVDDAGDDCERRATVARIERRARRIQEREVDRAIDRLDSQGELTDSERAAIRQLGRALADDLLDPVVETLERPADEAAIEPTLALFGE